MRVGKSIGLFFICAVFFATIGFWAGHHFAGRPFPFETGEAEFPGGEDPYAQRDRETLDGLEGSDFSQDLQKSESQEETEAFSGFLDAVAQSSVLCSDTEYVLEETDVLRGTVIETVGQLPGKYVGMDRESFIMALEQYEASPPLSERERGFVGLEVLSFSREKVVVQMNYRYVQPGESFYLALQNHEIVVLLEDKQTVYIETGIPAEALSQELQEDLIDMVYVENEASLYDLLEAYSS